MVQFKYRSPNLLELILLVGFFINMLLGFLLMSKSIQLPLAAETTAAITIVALFAWLNTLWVSVVAIILEYIRREIEELREELKK
ncbi:MAG: hypothetical protein ACP5G1_04440 [Nanopusillaceae archaeon]